MPILTLPSQLVNDAESTLALTVTDLRSAVGHYLGYTRDAARWSARAILDIDKAVSDGLRRFYFSHNWWFLKPVATLTVTSGTSAYDLPGDFGGLEGKLTFEPDKTWSAVCSVPFQMIRDYRQRGQFSAPPTRAAIVPKSGTPGPYGQRSRIELWPTPDATYQLTYRYHILPGALTPLNPYPYGGVEHAETIQAACIACAERSMNDTAGEKQQYFAERFAASVQQDAQRFSPESFGSLDDPHGSDYGYDPHRLSTTSYVGVP
jgi:hypothetical protein